MAITKIQPKQIKDSTNPGSILSSDTSNNFSVVSPSLGADHLWFYDHSATALVPLTVGTNLSITGTTLNASAGAGGYAEVQEEGGALTARTKINFIGGGITATDDAGNTRTNVTLDATLNALAAYNTNGILTQTAADTFVGRTITGTAARITMTNGDGVSGNPTVDIAATYVGQSSITTLGTITTGVWTGTAIAAINGGTGQTTYAVGDLLSANTTTSLSRVAAVASGSVLKSAGVSTLPVWGTLASTDLSNTANIALLSANQTFAGNNTFSNNITMNGTPSATTDVVTVGYINNIVANGLKFHSVRGASTGALTISGRTTTTLTVGGTSFVQDGVTFANGEYYLLKDNATGAGGGSFDNGAYVVSGVGSSIVLTRATYMDAAGEIDGHTFVIEDGTLNVGTIWITTSEVTTLGTDAIVFTQIQTSGTLTGSGANNQIAVWSGTNSQDGNSTFTWDQTQMTVGTATPVSSTRVTTQGTATGNTTFGLAHNNSSAAVVFKVADDGTTTIGASATSNIITGAGMTMNHASGYSIGTTANNLNLYASGNSSVTVNAGGTSSTGASFSAAVTRSDLTNNQFNTNIAGTFNPSGAGTNTYVDLNVITTINQTTHTGVSRSVWIHPTLTAVGSGGHTALEITASGQRALWTTAGTVRHDLGGDGDYDTWYRAATTGVMARLANGTTGQVLTATTSGAPSWQAAAGGTITRAYLTGSTSSVIDLDSGTAVTDVDGTNIAFTVPSDLDKTFVVRNGVVLSRSGTVSRDYTLVSATGVLTLASALTTDESLLVYKIV